MMKRTPKNKTKRAPAPAPIFLMPDEYSGHLICLSFVILEETENLVKVPVVGQPYMIRWVYKDDYTKALAGATNSAQGTEKLP